VESIAHSGLTRASIRWLIRIGCRIAAREVRCPIARHRVDAAGYLDPLRKRASVHNRLQRPGSPPADDDARCVLPRLDRARTVIVECKQSRADFLCDRADAGRLRDQLGHLHQVRRVMEDGFIKSCEPGLRQSGSSLFADLEDWDFSRSAVPAYQRLVSEIARVSRRLHGSSKFWLIAHYRLADALYIAAPTGMLRPHELPMGWGLLEVPRIAAERSINTPDLGGVSASVLVVAHPAPEHAGRSQHRQRLLRNIAAAATRDAYRRGVRGVRGVGG
jgi:hypothetical protein